MEFKRGTTSSTCPGQVTYSNIYYVTFCGILVSQVCWASENVATNNMFASRPDEYTPFFQWNRTEAWAATGGISGWNSTADNSTTWTVNPCPSGWRLPTQEEFAALKDLGSVWADAGQRNAAVAGRFYGPNSAYCALSNPNSTCIFLPAGGYRNSSGTLSQQGTYGNYWSSTQHPNSTNVGYGLYLTATDAQSVATYGLNKERGYNVRCVR